MPLPAVLSGVLPLHSHSLLKWHAGKWHFSMWRWATRAALHTDLRARSGGFSQTQKAKRRGDVILQAQDEKARPTETQQTEQWQGQQCFKGLSTTPWASHSRAGWQGKIATFSCCFFAGNSCFSSAKAPCIVTFWKHFMISASRRQFHHQAGRASTEDEPKPQRAIIRCPAANSNCYPKHTWFLLWLSPQVDKPNSKTKTSPSS